MNDHTLSQILVYTVVIMGLAFMTISSWLFIIIVWSAAVNRATKLFKIHAAVIEFIFYRKEFKAWKQAMKLRDENRHHFK